MVSLNVSQWILISLGRAAQKEELEQQDSIPKDLLSLTALPRLSRHQLVVRAETDLLATQQKGRIVELEGGWASEKRLLGCLLDHRQGQRSQRLRGLRLRCSPGVQLRSGHTAA